MTQTLSDIVAAHIRAEMARGQIRQEVLADALGLSQAGVSRRLRGLTPFDLNELPVVADVLGVPVSVLIGEAAA